MPQELRPRNTDSLIHRLGLPYTAHEDRVIIYKRPLGRFDAHSQLEDALRILTGLTPKRDIIKTWWGDV